MEFENALELKSVSKAYPGFLLDRISLSLPRGSVMGLIGENGAGKSTLIKLILGLNRPDQGEIRVIGKSREEYEGRDFRYKEQIGVVLDESAFPENLNLIQIERVLANVYHSWDSDCYFSMMERFSLPLKKPIKDFSKGMKMKQAIGAALSHRPRLLVMDEPTSGLDPVARDELLDLFWEFIQKEDHSILVSSHILSDLEKVCDSIAFLHEGRLIFSQEKDALKQRYGIFPCTLEELDRLEKENPACVAGARKNQFGARVLVDLYRAPENIKTEPASLEEMMLLLVRRHGA